MINSIKNRFYNKVLLPNENGCMDWIGRKNKNGYGSIGIRGKSVSVHRLSYSLHFGDIKNNNFVLHKCDNRKCVAPDHLFLGSQKENMLDMIKKGRKPNNSSFLLNLKNHPRAKLSESQVKQIKILLSENVKINEITKIFNISYTNVHHIKTNYSWRKLK